jgi:hypothetical protein
MSRARVGLLVVFLVGALSAIGAPAALATTGASITGTVTGPSGPVTGVCVDAYPSGSGVGNSANTTTNASGAYTITGLTPSLSYTVEVQPSCAATPNFQQQTLSTTTGAASSSVTLNVTLQPGATIAGTVTGGGAPLANICIDAYPSGVVAGSGASATTNAGGAYTLTGLTPSLAYTVDMKPCSGGADFVEQLLTVDTGVASGSVTLNATLQPGAVIAGTVTANGTPVANVCVDAYPSGAVTGSDVSARTNASGVYTLTGLTPSLGYSVEIEPSCAGDPNLLEQSLSTTTGAASSSVTLNAALQPGATITGTVSGNGAQLSDVCVEASPSSGNVGYAGAQTNASGTYTLTGLIPDQSYSVEFYQCPNGGNFQVQTLSETTGAASSSATLNVTLQEGSEITGTITEGSSPATLVCVSVTSDDGGSYPNAISTSSGTYTITGLTPGDQYDITFNPDCSSASAYLSTDHMVTAGDAGSSTELDVTLPLGGSITGKITNASQQVVTGASLCVEAEGPSRATATVSATDGTYTLQGLASGAYDVSAYECDGGTTYAQTYYGAAGNGTAVAVTAGGVVSGINIGVETSVSISGTIRGNVEGGGTTPVSGVCVDAWPNGSGGDATGTTDANGDYTIDGLTPGISYTIHADPTCGGTTTSGYIAKNYSAAVTPPGTGIDVTLPLSWEIQGTVTDSSGQRITTRDICVTAVLARGGLSGTAVIDSNGDYTIAGLAKGTYEVEFADCSTSPRDDVPQWYDGNDPIVPGGALSRYDSVHVVLSGEGNQAGIDAQMALGASISGTVYGNPTGGGGSNSSSVYSQSLSGICVDAFPTSQTYEDLGSGQATSASDGTYTISHLVPGASYDIYFSACDGDSASPWVSDSYGASSPWQEGSPVSAPATGTDGYMPKGGTISGTVTDSQGRPVTRHPRPRLLHDAIRRQQRPLLAHRIVGWHLRCVVRQLPARYNLWRPRVLGGAGIGITRFDHHRYRRSAPAGDLDKRECVRRFGYGDADRRRVRVRRNRDGSECRHRGLWRDYQH